MSKRMRFLAGIFVGVLVSFIVFRGGDIYNKFSRNGYQTFAVAIPNSLFKEGVVSPNDIKALAYTFNEAVTFATAHATQMKDNTNLKKLDVLLNKFNRYDNKYYLNWWKEHKKFFF